jgi:hypothetical protein
LRERDRIICVQQIILGEGYSLLRRGVRENNKIPLIPTEIRVREFGDPSGTFSLKGRRENGGCDGSKHHTTSS